MPRTNKDPWFEVLRNFQLLYLILNHKKVSVKVHFYQLIILLMIDVVCTTYFLLKTIIHKNKSFFIMVSQHTTKKILVLIST